MKVIGDYVFLDELLTVIIGLLLLSGEKLSETVEGQKDAHLHALHYGGALSRTKAGNGEIVQAV
jgi:hypothetical protein